MKFSRTAAGLLFSLGVVSIGHADVVCSMERCQDVGMQELDAYPAQNGFTPDAIFAIVENIIQLSGLTPNFQILETPGSAMPPPPSWMGNVTCSTTATGWMACVGMKKPGSCMA